MHTRTQQSRKTGCGQAAYTLVEVVIGVLVTGILMVTLYSGFSYGFTAVRAARENLRATQILVQRMETIRLYAWSQVLNSANYLKPVYVEYYDPTGIATGNPGEPYTAIVTATVPTNLPAAYRDNMRDVNITVYWTNRMGARAYTCSREMTTRVARYGMQNYIYGQ